MNNKIKKLQLLVIDRHPVIEKGLESFIDKLPDICIVAFAQSGLDGLEKLRQTPVDVILMELSLPDLEGTEALRLYQREDPRVAILIYSSDEGEASVYRALKAGARGYVLKSAALADVIEAIRHVSLGEYALSPSLNQAIIKFYLEHREQGKGQLCEYGMLTDREKQVFRMLADGWETQEISEALCISPKTVAKHRAATKKKLSLNNAVEMAQYAMRIGLLSPEFPAVESKDPGKAHFRSRDFP
ncbi:MAG: response regulator [Desulfuromonadales bacterium]